MAKILIIGGTGFIGEILTRFLAERKEDITLLIRTESREKISSAKEHQYKYITGSLLNKESLEKNLDNFDLVINLASVVRTIHKKKYSENIFGLKNLIDVLEKKAIKKLVYFSTQKVNLQEKGYYAQSKSEAEKLITNSKLQYLIIRPNHVYDLDKNNDFYRTARIMRWLHLAFLIGKGENKIQPLLRSDLAKLAAGQIQQFEVKGKSGIVEISGREAFSMNEIIAIIGKALGRKYFICHLPQKILRLFKRIVPFDIEGFTENMVSKQGIVPEKPASFEENIKQMAQLLSK